MIRTLTFLLFIFCLQYQVFAQMNFLNEDGDNAKMKEMLIAKGCKTFKGDNKKLTKCMSLALRDNLQKNMRFERIKNYLNAGRNKFFINLVIEKDGDMFSTNRDIHPKIKKEIDRSVKKMKFLNLEVFGENNSIKFVLPLNIVQKKNGIKAYYNDSQVQIVNTKDSLDRLPATAFCKYLEENDKRRSCVEDRVIVFLYNSVDRSKLKDFFQEGENNLEFTFILDQNTDIKNFKMKNKRQQVIASYMKSVVEKINFITPAYAGLKPQQVEFDVKLVYFK